MSGQTSKVEMERETEFFVMPINTLKDNLVDYGDRTQITTLGDSKGGEEHTGINMTGSVGTSYIQRTGDIVPPTIIQIHQQEVEPSEEYIKIMRRNYVSKVFKSLDEVQPHAKTADASVYINEILHAIRDMEIRSSKDPFLEILFALYDSLACNGLWATYSGDQFSMAREILESASKKHTLESKSVGDAIMKLEEIGFDTTPY